MTSATSREDVRMKAYELGIKDPARLNLLMRVVDHYVQQTAHKLAGVIESTFPPVNIVYRGREYPCRGCSKEKPLSEFPEAKQRDPSRNVNCIACQSKARYKCTGPCRQMRPLAEFPEKKRENPRRPSPCLWCEPKIITRLDAGHAPRVMVKSDNGLQNLQGSGLDTPDPACESERTARPM